MKTRLLPFVAALAMIAGMSLGSVDFEKEIRPILRERCVECHGAKKQKAALRLDARAFAFKGGENGTVFVPGQSAESKIIQRVTSADPDEVMPSKGERLTPAQIAVLREWIDAGAVWPEASADRDTRLIRHSNDVGRLDNVEASAQRSERSELAR